MTVPNHGLAKILTHGAGVLCSVCVVITYSRPSAVKPPKPLLRMRSGRGGKPEPAGISAAKRLWIGLKRGTRTSKGVARLNCSAKVPWVSLIITRATDWIRMRSSLDKCSIWRTKIPPGRSSTWASTPQAIRPRICSCNDWR